MATGSHDQDSRTPESGGVPESSDVEPSLIKIVELLGSVIAPVTVLSALLYYFGWVRENAVFKYFGVDPAILEFGFPEYLARSAGIAFRPLIIALLVAAITLLVGRAVSWATQRWPAVPITIRTRRLVLRPVPSSLLVCGLAAVSTGVAVAVGPATYPPPTWAAIALACGSFAIWYGIRLLATMPGSLRRPFMIERALLFGVTAIALFWAITVYAQNSGRELAESIDFHPESRPAVTIHSADELDLWTEPHVAAGKGKYPHTYQGFRLLIYANDRWLLLTGRLTTLERHQLVIVRDDDSVRIDVAGGAYP